MEFRRTHRNRTVQAYSLVEMIVAVAVGCMVLAGVLFLYLFSITSFASMANYTDLNSKSRFASDIITRDIRCALSVANATPSQLSLDEPNGTTTYTYDNNAGTLNRWCNGETQLLLSGVDSLSFALFQRPATNNVAPFEQYSPATPATAKLVSFQWSCSRQVRALQSDSESLEAALVEIRNK